MRLGRPVEGGAGMRVAVGVAPDRLPSFSIDVVVTSAALNSRLGGTLHRHKPSRPVQEVSYCRDLRVWFHVVVEVAETADTAG
jgi:hypothetical protein